MLYFLDLKFTFFELEETAKGVRISVHVYTNGRETAINEAIATYLETKQKCEREKIRSSTYGDNWKIVDFIPIAPMELISKWLCVLTFRNTSFWWMIRFYYLLLEIGDAYSNFFINYKIL